VQLTETLLAMSQHHSIESAIETVCEQQGLARTKTSSEWKYLFPAPWGSRVLELGAGIGDDSLALSSEGFHLVAAVPSSSNAELLTLRFREQSISSAEVAILNHVTELPWHDASFGGITLEDAAAAGFNLCHKTFPEFANECHRLLLPDGCVCVGIGNPMHASGPLHILKARQQAARHPESLNRMIKREGASRPRALRLGRVTRAMQAAGFAAPQLFAPMPDEKQTKAVLPLDSPEALHYYFDHLMRSDTMVIRTATRLMKTLIRIGLIQMIVPYYIALFRRQADSENLQPPAGS